MRLSVTPNADGFGARVDGISLQAPLSAETTHALRAAWLQHQVLFFPDQPMNDHQFASFGLTFGAFGSDPFVLPVEGHPHVLEIRREANERVSPFGSSWHSDWSFQACPPSATMLHARVLPPLGGDTWFADGYRAFEALSASMQKDLESLTAVHSARRPYSVQGFVAGGGRERSMRIIPSDDAWATQEHPVVRTHPETGRKALWINAVYTLGFKQLDNKASDALLGYLCAHATRDVFVYRHRWQENMLTMWDNRCTQHRATGGYDGHQRIMHRLVIAGDRPR
ncbi:MAG: TauD/TfdA family dioxygenase [Pseudomonadales bacterium]|nr:TauD/TfdA family dioxygenase [Pseudomonadales bacterium]